jgi:Carboxypeptidase regulatory-like domain
MLRRVVTLLTLLTLPAVAAAHGLDLTRTVANGTLTVILTYDDDAPCVGAVVKVLNASGEVVAEGKSDADGVCVLPAPPPGEYTIRAKTDDGHAAKGALTVSADPTPPETVTTRPPRLLYLALGLAGISIATVVFFWLGRRKRVGTPAAE